MELVEGFEQEHHTEAGGGGAQSGMIIPVAVYRLAQSGEFCSGIVGHRNGKSGAGDNNGRSPRAEWFTHSSRKGRVRNDGVASPLGGGLAGGRPGKTPVWGESCGIC